MELRGMSDGMDEGGAAAAVTVAGGADRLAFAATGFLAGARAVPAAGRTAVTTVAAREGSCASCVTRIRLVA